MRRLIGWTAGLAGVAALARLLARRRAATSPAPPGEPAQGQPPQDPPVDDPVDELRRKLAETRGPADFADFDVADPDTNEPAVDEPAVDEPEDGAPDETIAQRRRRVHEKAQEAIEAMKTLDG